MSDQEKTKVQGSRQGKRAVTLWLRPEVVRQINIIAAETDHTREDLFRAPLNWLFSQHGKPQIA